MKQPDRSNVSDLRAHVHGAQNLPRLSRTAVLRPELVALLENTSADQVTILRGPTGYGKTTIARQWLSESESPESIVWIDLRLHLNDETFWDGLRETVVRQLGSGRTLGSDQTTIEAILAHATTPIIFVFDEYSRDWDLRLGQRLLQLVRKLPHLHILITTRVMTRFELPAIAASLDMSLLTSRELQLSSAEIERIAESLGMVLPSWMIDHVAKRSEGWPLVARAALVSLSATDLASSYDTVDAIFSTIFNEVLDEAAFETVLSDEVLIALERCAAAPYLTAEIVIQLCPDLQPMILINTAEEAGLGSWNHQVLGRGTPVFEFVGPIRRELLTRLELRDSGASAFVAKDLMEVLERGGDAPRALRQALVLGDVKTAELIVIRNFTSVFAESAKLYFAELKESDSQALKSSTILRTVFGLLYEYHGHDLTAAYAHFRAACEIATSVNEDADPNRRFWNRFVTMVAWRKIGRFSLADDQLTLLLAMGSSFILPAFVLVELGITLLRLGRVSESVSVFERAAHGAQGDSGLYVYALGMKAIAAAIGGDVEDAERSCMRVNETLGFPDALHPLAVAPFSIAKRLVESERGHLPHSGQTDIDVPEISELRPYAFWQATWSGALNDELDAVLARLDDELNSSPIARPSNPETARLVSLKADLLMVQGRLAEAHQLIRAFSDGGDLLRPVSARLLLMLRRYDDAVRVSEIALLEANTTRTKLEFLLVTASAAKRRNHPHALNATLMRIRRMNTETMLRTPYLFSIASDNLWPEDRLPRMTPILAETSMAPVLTHRERVILERLHTPSSLEDIASALIVSINTVKTQTQSIYRKFGVKSRAEAVRSAFELGLIAPDQATSSKGLDSRQIVSANGASASASATSRNSR